MEYVLVKYPDNRRVFIDSHEEGKTNVELKLPESRRYIFDLGAPYDYFPQWIETEVSGTSADAPLEVVFEKGKRSS